MQGHVFSSISTFLLLLTIGCTPAIRTPAPEHADALRGKTIVLMKVTATEAGEPTKTKLELRREPELLRIANMDRWEDVLVVQQLGSPSPEAEERGWVYLALDPGTYYFDIVPITPALRFSIPPNTDLI